MEKEGPTGEKRLQHRWKKSIRGLEEIAVYKTAPQERVWGILKLEKAEELPPYLPARSQDWEQIQEDGQTRTKKANLEKKNFAGFRQMSCAGGYLLKTLVLQRETLATPVR